MIPRRFKNQKPANADRIPVRAEIGFNKPKSMAGEILPTVGVRARSNQTQNTNSICPQRI
jgi:hypothetical protein